MERQKIKQLGADSLAELIRKANERHISKEMFLQIIQDKGLWTLVYVGR